MRWLRRLLGLTPPPLVHRQDEIEFIGEKTGPVEEETKAQWRAVLSSFPALKRAYLATASYDRRETVLVVLGLVSETAPDHRLISALQKPFVEIFAKDEYVDFLFLTADQESQLSAVCRPFYANC